MQDYATKYLGKEVKIKIDRPIGSKHPKYDAIYPINYGYIENTIAPDGEGVDAYILGINEPIETFAGICIAVIHRTNDEDDKLIVASLGEKYSNDEIKSFINFQEKYYKSFIIRENEEAELFK